MKKCRRDPGSALLLAVIIVVMTVGIGGAFLAESVIHAREQFQVVEAEEAMTMCDAGMERARNALGVYWNQKTWSFNDILAYCNNSKFKPVDPAQPPDPLLIKADYMSLKNSPAFTGYTSALWASGPPSTVNVVPPGIPAEMTLPTPGDPTARGVVFGWNFPFHKGALHIHIRNNDDSKILGATGLGGAPLQDTDGTLMVTVTATLPSGMQRQVEGVLQAASLGAISPHPLSVVISKDSVSTNGNITIDGRDFDYTGTTVTGSAGVLGILSTKTISVGGSSAVGGNGNAPDKKGAAPNSLAPNHLFLDGYPQGPDDALGLPKGSLKAAAQAAGTYCGTPSDWSKLLSDHGGRIPDHAIVYCEFDAGNGSFDLGGGNTQSSVLVVHTDTYTGTISQVHGSFKGALLADAIVHVNAGTSITGMIQLFSPTSSSEGNVLGNGNSTIRYSSAVLADLPGLPPARQALKILSYRKTL
jgi:hypothetical protein